MPTLAGYVKKKQRNGTFFPPETIRLKKRVTYRCNACGRRFRAETAVVYPGMAPDPDGATQTASGTRAIVNCPDCGQRIPCKKMGKSQISVAPDSRGGKRQWRFPLQWVLGGVAAILLGLFMWQGRRTYLAGEEAFNAQDMEAAFDAYQRSALAGWPLTRGASAGKYAWCLTNGLGCEPDPGKAAFYAGLACLLWDDPYGHAAAAELAWQDQDSKPAKVLQDYRVFIESGEAVEPEVYRHAIQLADAQEEESAAELEYQALLALIGNTTPASYQDLYNQTEAFSLERASAVLSDYEEGSWMQVLECAQPEEENAWMGWYLGRCYWLGRGTQTDDEAALRWWLTAARQGNGQAAAQLALVYFDGGAGYGCSLTEKNEKLALALALSALPQGQDQALWVITSICEQGGSEEELEFVWGLLTAAAEQGSGEAYWLMANSLREGTIGQENSEENNDRALQYYQKAIENGCVKAKRTLAICYYNGLLGLERDVERGVQMLEEAAEAGDGTALYTLSQVYQSQEQEEKAEEYLLQAARLRTSNYTEICERAWQLYGLVINSQ